ncbi:hypothetical protein GGR52DRAFT_591167 [Hypoxylon sp. FL1284]|nr:hypothetical protein GGR52DRAFT_591167 [Hypoxylon sp. FL1284]
MDLDADFSFLPPGSQPDPHFPLQEPISGATLYELEVARRERVRRRGRIRTGCVEIDDAVLQGGFERGSVVGISAEDGDFGLLLGLQTVARTVAFDARQRAAVVTTLPAAAVLPMLRDAVGAQVRARLGSAATHQQALVNDEVRRCLERVSVSRVFDVEGLWEVVGELETPTYPAAAAETRAETPPASANIAAAVETAAATEEVGENTVAVDKADEEMSSSPLSMRDSPPAEEAEEMLKGVLRETSPARLPSLSPPRMGRMEIGDSEEEDDEALELSQSPSSSSAPKPPMPSDPPSLSPRPAPLQEPRTAAESLERDEEQKQKPEPAVAAAKTNAEEDHDGASHIPDLIVITHFSTLLANLFTRAADDKAAAHTTLQLLSSHLRYLARSSSSCPLIALLNTTTTTTTSSSAPAAPGNSNRRPPDPTLRSVFASRSGKPAFGATFAQFLDLHLLCGRAPRGRGDAEALYGSGGGDVRYAWVVEVLLDELGAWGGDEEKGKGKGEGKGSRRKSREQRWGAVDVRGGVVIVDSFPGAWQQQMQKQKQVAKGPPVRLAAGFGGPPARGL